MRAWLESVAGPEYASALMWTVVALIGLLVVLVIVRIVRGLTFGTFVAGGRNRKTRLAVMDATAVDSQRRLVLVRRDDVEHLILIGGPSDLVVEQNIRLSPPARRPVDIPAEQKPEAPAAPPPSPSRPPVAHQPPGPHSSIRPNPVPRSTSAFPAARPRSSFQPSPATAPSASPYSRPASEPRPVAPAAAASGPASASAFGSPPGPAKPGPALKSEPDRHDLDEALLEELEVTLDKSKPGIEPDKDKSIEDEMSKLLGELSNEKR